MKDYNSWRITNLLISRNLFELLYIYIYIPWRISNIERIITTLTRTSNQWHMPSIDPGPAGDGEAQGIGLRFPPLRPSRWNPWSSCGPISWRKSENNFLWLVGDRTPGIKGLAAVAGWECRTRIISGWCQHCEAYWFQDIISPLMKSMTHYYWLWQCIQSRFNNNRCWLPKPYLPKPYLYSIQRPGTVDCYLLLRASSRSNTRSGFASYLLPHVECTG